MSCYFRLLVVTASVMLASCTDSSQTSNAITQTPSANNRPPLVSPPTNTVVADGQQGSAIVENTSENMVPTGGLASENIASENSVKPAEPIGFKGVVYTSTEIELFWEPANDTSIVQYRVQRDGMTQATLDALSFYDNTVVAGNTYEYTISSVDSNGNFSNAESLFLTTPEAAPTINETNAEALLSYVATISNGAVFSEALASVATLTSITSTDVAVSRGFVKTAEQSSDFGISVETSFDCDQGGELFVRNYYGSPPNYTGSVANCSSQLFVDRQLDGTFSTESILSKYVNNTGFGTTLSLSSVAITDDAGHAETITGDYDYFNGTVKSWTFEQQVQNRLDENDNYKTYTNPFIYLSPAFAGRTEIVIVRMSRSRGTFGNIGNTEQSNGFMHKFGAEFSVQSPATGNKLITVSTPQDLVAREEGACFSSGQLLLSADDGSKLLLDAGSGSLATVDLITTANGITTTRTIDWSSKLAFMHATPTDVIDNAPIYATQLPAHSECGSPI